VGVPERDQQLADGPILASGDLLNRKQGGEIFKGCTPKLANGPVMRREKRSGLLARSTNLGKQIARCSQKGGREIET